MFKFSRKYKNPFIFPLSLMLVMAFLFFDVEAIWAHTPHHVVDVLELSPAYNQDSTLYIIVQNHLLKSTNGGISWKELVQGLDNKFIFSSIAISPSFKVDQTVFMSSDGDGIYKSQDGGASWDKVNRGLDDLAIGLLAISSEYVSDEVILAAGVKGGLYKTNDGGGSWYEVIDKGVKVTTIAFSLDLNRKLIVMGDDEGQVWFSNDEGEAWEQGYQIAEGGRVTTIAISDQVSKDGTIFVGTERRGVFKTVDGGASFVELKDGPSRYTVECGGKRLSSKPSNRHVTSLALSPNYGRDGTIFASTRYDAVFRSDDGGKTWKKHDAGVTCVSQADEVKVNSTHFRHLRISKAFEEDGTIFLAGYDGLFKSTDGGRTWMQLEVWSVRSIRGLGVSPADEYEFSVAITTYGGGAYTTDDQGVTWKINNSGLRTTRLADIIFSPNYHSDNIMFSASQGMFLRSTNGADNWYRIDIRYKGWRKKVSSILKRLGAPRWLSTDLFLKESEQRRYFPMLIVASPEFATDETVYFGTRYHGIWKSSDGGLTWSSDWDGPVTFITALVISPNFASDKTLFASMRGAGIYKTVDGGQTWHSANNGFEFLKDIVLPVSPNYNLDPALFSSLKDVKLVISPNYKIDKILFASSAEGLFKTTNGGASWQRLDSSPHIKSQSIESLAISPGYENNETLLVSIKGKGLFKTNDGGFSFVEIGDELIDSNYAIKFIEFSPLYPGDNTIYAASEEELFRSTDGGSTWEIIPRPVRYENWRGEGYGPVKFKGSWEKSEGSEFSATSISHSDVAHDTATLHFVGTGVSWIGAEDSDRGVAKVYIDGNYVEDVDQFGDVPRSMVTSFSVTDLDYGPHVITIEVTDTKNPAATGYRIAIDAFDIMP
jgi:photosystem II stability/assembly factor-like uncharacterized protein